MYCSEDLERFFFQYQTEAMPKGISVEQFCLRDKVPYNIFYKWYKDTRKKIVEVKVDGLPSSAPETPKEERHLHEYTHNQWSLSDPEDSKLSGLKALIEKLEVLC